MASSTHDSIYASAAPTIDPYGTHIRVVAEAAARCAALFPQLPMLELGAGHYSTPIIHAIAPEHVLIEADGTWSMHFAYAKPIHGRWAEYRNRTPHLKYSFALLDNEEKVVDRIKHIAGLLELAHVVAMHDVRNNAMPHAVYNYVDKAYAPWSWVGSNEIDVTQWFR